MKEDWPTLYYSNLTANFVDEILAGRENEGGFADAAWVQEVINAVERSHHERGWVGCRSRRSEPPGPPGCNTGA